MILYLILLYILIALTESLQKITFQFKKIDIYSNNLVTNGLLWSIQTNNVYVCSIRCHSDNQCVSFFFGNGACDGYYDVHPNSVDVISHVHGTEFYKKKLSATEWCSDIKAVTFVEGGTTKCFKAYQPQVSWADAETFCQTEGGNLAILNSDAAIGSCSSFPENDCGIEIFSAIINKCYWTTASPANWHNSATTCAGASGILASFPDSQTYNDILNRLGILGSVNYWWIGINDITVESTYTTYDNQPIPWWNLVALWGYFGRDCLYIKPTESYQWEEGDCSVDVHRAVCERQLGPIYYWVGGTDLAVENNWIWRNGATMDMTKWHTSEPNGNTAENCATLQFDLNGNKFASENCAALHKFICERIV